MKSDNALLHRWAMELENFSYTVRYRPGKKQTHVDALSRLPIKRINALWQNDKDIEQERNEIKEAILNKQRPAWMSERLFPHLRFWMNQAIDNEGRIFLGPKETKEVIKRIHHSLTTCPSFDSYK